LMKFAKKIGTERGKKDSFHKVTTASSSIYTRCRLTTLPG
jgi:hypothetical protein